MGSNEWLQRQLKMVQLVENKKTAPPVTVSVVCGSSRVESMEREYALPSIVVVSI